MKSISFLCLLFIAASGHAQYWQAGVMVGVSGYNGDLTQKEIAFNRMRPSATFNLIYTSGDFVNFRIGIGYGKITGDDKKNTQADLKSRNLSFQSNLLELNVGAEFNLFDPELYNTLPYIFLGVGLFRFNPYAYDNDNKKVYLQPLGTEGQGLSDYPERKKYSLTQFCIPVGLGVKIKKNKWELGYELGVRIIFTDYLDDVSKTYVSLEKLSVENGPKAAEMSFRRQGISFAEEGATRGNPTVKDRYFFSGVKLAFSLGTIKGKDKVGVKKEKAKKEKTNKKVKKEKN
jgi:hypothetical protein